MSAMRTVGPPLLAVGVALALWSIAVRLSGVPAYLLPGPEAVFAALIDNWATLGPATLRTAGATFAGFGLAAVIGVATGTLLAAVGWLRRGVYPLTNLLQMVPLVAIAPLLTIWFGYGATAVTASACLVALFPVIANTVDGLRGVDPRLIELFEIYRARRWDRWWQLELPAATPAIITGLRIAAGLAVIGAVVGEFVSGFVDSHAPIGIVILSGIREGRTDLVFAAIGLSAAVGFMLFGLVSLGGHLALRRWHPSAVPTPSEHGA